MEMSMSDNTGSGAAASASGAEPAPKVSFVDKVKGTVGGHWSHTKSGDKIVERGIAGKVGIVAGSVVGLGVAYDGIRRMITSPVDEAGNPEGQTFGRVAAGLVETGAGLALTARSLTGKWTGRLHA
jgi:hypothetical protein